MATPTKSDIVIQSYGNSEDVYSLAKRIKVMVPGGSNLKDSEAQALAQVSIVTKCNPFIGEIWYIPGRGPMIGIKGARRHGNEQIEKAGGKDAYWFPDLLPCTAQEAGAPNEKEVAHAFKCIITDSVSTSKYQRLLLETVNTLRASGSKDPIGEAREIVGKKPQWIGYGYSTIAEQSKMNKLQLAQKRAEADALKKRFDIPFGTEVSVSDTARQERSEWDATQFAASEDDVDAEFPPVEEQPAIELVPVLGEWAVNEAAQYWNCSKTQAAKDIGKRWQGNMDKREFLDLLHGNPDKPEPSAKRNPEEIIKELQS